MARLVARLLLLIAVVLMPVGMGTAPVAAHSAMTAEMPAGHCPGEQRNRDHTSSIAGCAMACAAALPAAERPEDAASVQPTALITAAQPQRLHGLHPETATPPPRMS